ncbi:MAG: hypothetical protein RIT22_1873, partial [Bacteroidota bacterium]
MKKIALSLAIIAAVFTGCSSDDETEVVKVPVTGEITGDLTVSKTYAYGNYTLKGFAKVASGVTITFEAGSTITADKADGEDAFVILNGGKLIAVGTATEPIVFTEKSKVAGSWGG